MIAAAAPAILDAAAVAPAAPATPAAANAAPAGFDAILLLQGLAVTTDAQDIATFEAADTTEALASEDGDEDDELDDLETSLAFLADLVTVTAPARNSSGDLAAGAGEQGASEEDSPPLATALKAEGGFALEADAAAEDQDILSALTPVKPEALEQRAAADASQGLTRAAELLAQSQRQVISGVDRPGVVTHVRDPRWADDFSARVSLVVRAGESTASLQLTPVDLGPVEVNVTVKDSQATIHFGAAHAETRALIEASLPRLRELLASQGFNLTDASVSSGFSRSQQQAQGAGARASGEAETSTVEARPLRALGMLDVYA